MSVRRQLAHCPMGPGRWGPVCGCWTDPIIFCGKFGTSRPIAEVCKVVLTSRTVADETGGADSERDLPRGDAWLTIKEACAEVDVTRRTIYNWIAAGKLEVRRTAGGNLRIARRGLWRNADPSSRRR